MEFIIIIILILSLSFIGYCLYMSLKRINELENIIYNFYDIVNFISARIRKIDNTGHFESDDEVGFFFNELKKMSELLSSNFESDENNNNIQTGEEFDAQENNKKEG